MTMNSQIDPRWPKTLSHLAHEVRNPVSVIVGWIQMVRKERMGPLTDQQRYALAEVMKSCTRLAALADELSELSKIEGGTAASSTRSTDLNAVLRAAIDGLPPPDREVGIELQALEGQAPVTADPARLGQALGAIIAALRREVVKSDRLIVRAQRKGASSYEILLGDDASIQALEAEPADSGERFDEWRGSSSLSLVNARRTLSAHGGTVQGPSEGSKASARIVLPIDSSTP